MTWWATHNCPKGLHPRGRLLDAGRIKVADGGLEIGTSDVCGVVANDAPGAGPFQLVSAFQGDLSFIRLVRLLHWYLGHEDGAGFLSLPLGSPA